MVFQGMAEQGGWVIVEYKTTWPYGYDFMLDAAQTIIDTDFRDKLQRVAVAKIAGAKDEERLDQVKACASRLRSCPSVAEECGVLTVSGISQIMECAAQFVLFNQTRLVRLVSPFPKYFKDHGEHVFDHYMDSIEIKAYCMDTERRTMQKIQAEK